MEKEKKLGDILCKNILILMNNSKRYSMRRLSLEIGASDSYMQKILSQKAHPSFEKIEEISHCFGCQSWELFYDYDKFFDYESADISEYIDILRMVCRMPKPFLPMIRDHLEYLMTLR